MLRKERAGIRPYIHGYLVFEATLTIRTIEKNGIAMSLQPSSRSLDEKSTRLIGGIGVRNGLIFTKLILFKDILRLVPGADSKKLN
jgi:hypothetical protein